MCRFRERRTTRRVRVPVGDADRRRLLEGEDVVEVVGARERVDQRQLGASGIAENVTDAFGAQHLEQYVSAVTRLTLQVQFPLVQGVQTVVPQVSCG